MRKFIEHYGDATKLLKYLVRTKADDAYVQLVWDSIQTATRYESFADYCCSVPLPTLKSLVHEPNIPIHSVQKMLSMLGGFQWHQVRVPKEAHVLYTAMFWEVSERALAHLLDQVPNNVQLDYPSVWRLLLMTKYSDRLCSKFFDRLRALGNTEWAQMIEFRPGLDKELDP